MCPPEFLKSIFNSAEGVQSDRPRVTLTFAQSIDGKIAGKDGRQLILSGKESMEMTHWMRTMHDAILVGIGTVLNDDPQLNIRHIPGWSQEDWKRQRFSVPRPVILDPNLRFPLHCKLLKNYNERRGRRPWIICSNPSFRSTTDANMANAAEWTKRKNALELEGARIFEVESADESGHIFIPALLGKLWALGVRTLMVEGGASIINSFLTSAARQRDSSSPAVVDVVIITIAPVLVGGQGVGYADGLSEEQIPVLQDVTTHSVGRDAVVAGTLT